ncbi:ribosomal protein L35 [Phytophthora nicotianae CJ01A1]|uniref:50S ribosomal protein L35 n=6 Tax=Phytophthora nicotianae TaxID=4792 RepID=W2PIW6_PHYN3|nr:ribosomal protein L35 [Phytophthora nicotianae INRA-310]ETI32174.1 ribosomal protein L35 [Phytophthora nicotianae P1569]ETK72551.1 ribosomal protein L35 [Phytophthora nicotianae]ETO60927.1 ribosomal protein L35 [Phytophthora nicotianae P1976]ETP02036.1 ribosomal protein L35 [Phytophthora nicotianae CJ01A1]ETP30195.1 ribosomal protein L35 [Phytophthora nicotianae P10297]KUF95812.1 50S ribosomal protein L35 [Phytophthora nicotianae]
MALFRSLARQFKALSVSQPAVAQAPRFAAVTSAPSASSTLVSTLAVRAAVAFPQLQVRAMGYKLKTKAAVKKRFKVNCNGLVKRAQANKRHIATKKTRERIRRLGKPVFVQGQIRKNVLRMLGKK